MTLESAIRDVLNEKLTDGTVEKLVAKNIEQGINSALHDMFRSYGDMTKVIENKLKEVMVPYIENHDFSQYLVKIDAVLLELTKSAIPENKVMLENFQTLMKPAPKSIKVSELFEKWCEYAQEHIDTDDLEIDYDDEPTYENSEVSMSFEQFDKSSYSIYDYGELVFTSDHDEKLNVSISLSKWERRSNSEWEIDKLQPIEFSSLRYADEFTVFLYTLKQADTKIELDTDYQSNEIVPNESQEASY